MVITISCAACETSFPVDPNKIPEAGVKVRCSLCAHVFRVERPAAGPDVVTASEPIAEAEVEPDHEIGEGPSGAEWAADAPDPAVVGIDPDPYSLDAIEIAGAEDGSVLADPDAMPDWAVVSGESTEKPTAEPSGSADTDEPTTWPELDPWALPDAHGTPEPMEFVEAAETDAGLEMDEAFPSEVEVTFEAEPPLEVEVTLEAEPPLEVEVTFEVEPPLEAEPPLEVEVTFEAEPLPGGQPNGLGEPAPEPVEWVDAEPDAFEPEAETEQREPVAELEAPPAPVQGFTFGKRDPMDKARRLARVLVSDMVMYNAERHQLALQRGTLAEDFEEEIDKSWKEFVDQVGPDIADGEGRGFWTQSLNDILARGAQLF